MSLCLSCGLCCDGTMFLVAAITPSEAAKYAGRLDIAEDGKHLKLPCTALDGCKCTTYLDRPAVCAEFKCLALASLELGTLTSAEAHEAIAEVLGRRQKVADVVRVKDPRQALVLARRQATDGTASEELRSALTHLKQALLLMTLAPNDRILRKAD